MPIIEYKGDVIHEARRNKGILVHQVNTFGVMGGGLAKSIKEKVLSPEQYAAYQRKCAATPLNELIGAVDFMKCPDGMWVANMFSQNTYCSRNGCFTNYEALYCCLKRVKVIASTHNVSVFIPYRLGCGIAGGDWSTVKIIVDNLYNDETVEANIVRLED